MLSFFIKSLLTHYNKPAKNGTVKTLNIVVTKTHLDAKPILVLYLSAIMLVKAGDGRAAV